MCIVNNAFLREVGFCFFVLCLLNLQFQKAQETQEESILFYTMFSLCCNELYASLIIFFCRINAEINRQIGK